MENPQNNSLIKISTGLLAAINSGNFSIDVFSKDILVLTCLVAGTSFRKLKDIEPKLEQLVKIDIKREAGNKFDEFAVALFF